MKARGKALGLLLAAFLSGALSGGLIVRAAMQHAIVNLMKTPPDQIRENVIVWRLHQEFPLSDQQDQRIRAILKSHNDEARVARAPCVPAATAIRERQQAEIREVLTPDQRPAFDALLKTWTEAIRLNGGL